MVGSATIRSGGRQRRDAVMSDPPDQLVYRLPEPFEVFFEREYHSLVSLGYALIGTSGLAAGTGPSGSPTRGEMPDRRRWQPGCAASRRDQR
jgi:hypothetical protein